MNFRGMLSNIRTRLDDPMAQRPSDRALLLLLSTQVQRFMNRLNLSGRSWAVDEVDLVVGANVEDYPVPADNFGKALEVRTVDPGNASHVVADVMFTELTDINLNWPWPRNIANSLFNWDGSRHTASRIAFYRRAGLNDVYARVMPVPQGSAQYKILYQIGEFGSTVPLDESVLLPEHHPLIEIRTALAALPHCWWSDDKADNTERRKQLAMALVEAA